MANRYWVGGTGNWDNLALLKWSTTSGGLGGSAVPTSADTVFFDANSGANTVTIGAGTAICSTLTMTGFTGTLAFGTNSIALVGTGTIYTGATTFTVTGTPLINITGTGTLTVTAGAVTEANSISFTINNAASNSVGVTGNVRNLTFAGTYTGTLSNQTRTIYGNLTLKTGMTVNGGGNGTTFAATSGTQTITSAGLNLDFAITLAGTATYRLADNLSVGTSTSRTITLTSGTLDLNDKTLTNFGVFSSTNSNTRSILFGTTGNYTNTNTATATVWSMATATNFTYTGTSAINLTGNIALGITRTVLFGSTAGATESNALNFTTTAGQSGSIATFPSSALSTAVKDLIFTTGFAGSLASNTRTIYGNFTCSSTMSHVSGTNTTSFSATSGTQEITLAGTGSTFDSPVTFNGTATYQLQDAFITGATRAVTLTAGTLNLNNNSFTSGTFSTNNSNTRSIAFGTGQIYVTGNNASVYSNSTATGFTATGSKIVNCTYTGSSGTRNIASQGTAEADMINFKISAGSDIFTINTSRSYGSIEFTSGFTGTINNTSTASISIYGDVTLPPSPAVIGTAFVNRWTLASATNNQTFTSNGQTVQFEIAKSNGTTASLIFADDFVSTQQIILTSGTFNSNGKNITCSVFGYVNTNTKTLTLTNSTVTITGGTSNSGFNGSNTGTTFNIIGASVIFTTSGTALFNAGGNTVFPAVTMSGTGQLIIGQASTAPTIETLANTVSPCTISLLSTMTRLIVTNFNLSGTAGNLVTFNSSVAGTARTISKASGTVNAQYMYIQDSTATGGATWNAQFSTDAGNNTGWTFSTIFTGDVSEAFSILDIINVLSAFTTSATEPVTVADTLDTTAAFISNTTEPITLADTPSTTATFATVITENASFADITSSLAAFAAAIVEAANLADSSIVIRIHNSDLTEAITLDDSQTVIADFVDVVFEDINIEDFPTVEASFLAVITEDTNLAAFQAVAATFAASLAEAITSADASIGIRIHNSAATEIITLDNAQTALRTQYALIVENLVPADAPTVIASFNSQITENLVLLDSPFPRGWYAINDGQTVTWTKVNNSYP